MYVICPMCNVCTGQYKCTHMCTCVYTGNRQTTDVFFNLSLYLFWRQVLSLNVNATGLDILAGQ